jgi:hypothetical protein
MITSGKVAWIGSITAVVCVLAVAWLAGCASFLSFSPAGGGTLTVMITDAPFPFDRVSAATVTIDRIEVHRADDGEPGDVDGTDTDGAEDGLEDTDEGSEDPTARRINALGNPPGLNAASRSDDLEPEEADEAEDGQENEEAEEATDPSWIVIPVDEQEVNLLDLRNGKTEVLAQAQLESGRYDQVRLIVTEGCIAIDGDEACTEEDFVLRVPSGAQTGIKLHFEFEVPVAGETTLLCDFDLSRAFVPIPGGPEDESIRQFHFRPSYAIRMADMAESGAISGVVSDETGAAVPDTAVTAVAAGDEVATTATEADGSYMLLGLPGGAYSVVFTASGFADAQVDDVAVAAGTTTEGVDASLAPPKLTATTRGTSGRCTARRG